MAKIKHPLLSVVILVVVLFSAILLIRTVVPLIFRVALPNSMPYEIYTSLMKPNYNPGEIYFVTTSKERIAQVKRDEVIVHTYPKELSSVYPSEDLAIHRIVGLPGEKIEVKNNKLNINGVVFNSQFMQNSGFRNITDTLLLDNDMYLVLPDIIHDENINYRFIRKEDIIGVVGNCIRNCQ